jgi:hypothetical protein
VLAAVVVAGMAKEQLAWGEPPDTGSPASGRAKRERQHQPQPFPL